MNRRALITGATGFVGTHLAERLVQHGWTPRALVRSSSDTRELERLGVERVVGDLDDLPAMRAAASGVEVVYHLAAVTFGRSEDEYHRANAGGVANLVRALAESGPRPRRVVYLSSYAACGPATIGQPRRNDETPAPLTAYGRSKLAGEAALHPLREQGIEVLILRSPAVYGPGDRALLSYFQLVRRGLAPVPAGEDRRLHMIYAPDLAAALAHAADASPGTYAVAEPVEHRWSEVVGTIARTMGRRPLRIPLPPPLVRAAAAVTETVGGLAGRAVPFNREKAREMLAEAWTCDLAGSEALLPPEQATPLAEGIASTIQWYRSQGWL
jgi:nucleoside-diphosphate-sugar epimerase